MLSMPRKVKSRHIFYGSRTWSSCQFFSYSRIISISYIIVYGITFFNLPYICRWNFFLLTPRWIYWSCFICFPKVKITFNHSKYCKALKKSSCLKRVLQNYAPQLVELVYFKSLTIVEYLVTAGKQHEYNNSFNKTTTKQTKTTKKSFQIYSL